MSDQTDGGDKIYGPTGTLTTRLYNELKWDLWNIIEELPYDEDFFKFFVERVNPGYGFGAILHEDGVEIYTSEPEWEKSIPWSKLVDNIKHHESEYVLRVVKAMRGVADEIEKHYTEKSP